VPNEIYHAVNGQYDCHVLRIAQLDNYFDHPCPSKYLQICFVRDYANQHKDMRVVQRANLGRKVVVIPMSNAADRVQNYLFCPMLHDQE